MYCFFLYVYILKKNSNKFYYIIKLKKKYKYLELKTIVK